MQKWFLVGGLGVAVIGIVIIAIGLQSHEGPQGRNNSSLVDTSEMPADEGAVLTVSPSSGSHSVGDTFSVDMRMDAAEEITSVRAVLNFDSSLLRVISISAEEGSFQTYWETSSANGRVQVQASHPAPGISGDDLLVATITFQTLDEGTADLVYHSNSLVLEPDDTDILDLAGSASGSYKVSSASANGE